jgi:hypothetical protein
MSGLVIQTEGHPLEDAKDVKAHGKNRLRVEVNVWLHYDDQQKSVGRLSKSRLARFDH